jgi:hypothetical protein
MAATPQNFPNFPNLLGNVFGWLSVQWQTFFASKVDAEMGTADNLTLTGTVNATQATIIGQLQGVFQTLAVNNNVTSLPKSLPGTIVQTGNADGAANRLELDSFGAASFVTVRRADGTNASPSAVTSGDELGSFNSYGYVGGTVGVSGYLGPAAAIRTYAAGTGVWTSTSTPAEIRFSTASIGSTTLTDRFHVGGGLYSDGVTGGDPGPGGVNAASIQVNGAALAAVSTPLTIVNKTANYALQTTDSGSWFSNTGGTGAVNLTLPGGTIGLNFGALVSGSVGSLAFVSGSGATINFGGAISAFGGNVVSGTVGCAIRLLGLSSSQWIVVSATGQWTVN